MEADDRRRAQSRFRWAQGRRLQFRLAHDWVGGRDVTQDVFLVLLRAPASYDPSRGPLRPFLLGVARNLALTRLHQESRWDVLDEEQFAAEPLEVDETSEMVARAVSTLPPLQREALILAQYEELSLEEIAIAVHAEVGTIKSRLFRARENLRRMLSPLKSRRSVSYGTIK